MTKLLDLDLKGDTAWVLRHPSVLPFDALDFAPLACPEYSTPREFLARVRALYEEMFWGAALQSGVITPVLEELITTSATASLAEMQRRIRERDKSPAGKGADQRLDTIRVAYPTIFASEKNLWTKLHETSIYFAVDGPLSPPTRFLFWQLVSERFAYLKAIGHRDKVHTLILLDEAPATFSHRQQTVSGLPPTPVQLLPTTREHGLQFVVVSPSWNELHPLILSQFQVQVALQPSDGRELDAIAKSFRLTPAKMLATARMPRGTGIGKVRGIEQPFMFTYPPFTEPKDIDEQTLAAARARAKEFCSTRLAAKEWDESVGQQPAAQAPPATPPSRIAPAVQTKLPHQTTLPLNDRERAECTLICKRGIVTVVEVLQQLGLQPMQENRARKNLKATGYITESRILIHGSRGGSAVALTATEKARADLGLSKPHLGRGGSQHVWILRQLRDHLGATLEVHNADAVITYDPVKHERLRAFLNVPLNTGDTIAVEIEISRPTVERHLARNAAYTLTVFATMPKHVKQLRASCAGQERAIVVDALQLLTAICGEAA